MVVTLLLGGTARSHAAPAKNSRNAAKNHSTSVKNEATGSDFVVCTTQRAGDGEGPEALKTATAGGRAAATITPDAVKAALTSRCSKAAKTPRAARGRKGKTRSSSPRAQTSDRLDEAFIREALARRQAWNEPRRDLLQPGTVKDPPAGREPIARAVPAAAVEIPGQESGALGAGQPAAERGSNDDLIKEALRNRGQPYVWGGASRGGFDCSGFICYLFRKQRGMKLPHSASAQSRLGTPVRSGELQPGDLVFFSTYRPGISHVGVFIGENRFIHAANRRRDVRIDSLDGYYAKRLRCARRLSPAPLKFSTRDLSEFLKEPSQPPPDEDLIDP
jgi:cell wall-associated NlpC family hydrolase